MAHVLVLERRYDRDFVRRWVNWEEYLREERPDCPARSRASSARSRSSTRATRRSSPSGRAASPPRRIVEIAREIAPAGSALATHVWRNAAAGNLGGWQVARALHSSWCSSARWRRPAAPRPAPAQVRAGAALMPPPGRCGRAADAARVPARVLRDVFLLPHFLKEGRGKIAMYFTRVYNPVWTNPDGHVVDRDAHRRGEDRAPRLPHADLERDRVVRRLRPADGPCLRAPRPHVAGDARRALDRLPPAGPARGAASARPRVRLDWQAHEAAGLRCGRRTSSGSSCRGASIPTARSASASTSSRPIARARSSGSRSTTGGSSRTPCRACRRPREGGARAARVHAQVRRVPRRGRRVRDARRAGRGEGPRGRRVDPVTRLVKQGGQGSASRSTARARGLSHALAQARVLLEDAQGLEVARAGRAGVCAEPRALGEPRPRQGRDGAAADVPAADAHPHAVRQCQVADGARTPIRSGCIHRMRSGSASRPAICSRSRRPSAHFVDRAWVTEGLRPGIIACSHHIGRWRLAETAAARGGRPPSSI